MPKKSLKELVKGELETLQAQRLLDKVVRTVVDDDDEETVELLLDLAVDGSIRALEEKRYIEQPRSRNGSKHQLFQRDLEIDKTGVQLPWLNDEEFKQKYRVCRHSFWSIVDLIKHHPVFDPAPDRTKGRKQTPVEHQLMVLLNYLGTSGSGANNLRQRSLFGIGHGTAHLYRKRCVKA